MSSAMRQSKEGLEKEVMELIRLSTLSNSKNNLMEVFLNNLSMITLLKHF